MIVDLACNQARLGDGARDGGLLVRAPLIPEPHADEGGERNDAGDDKSDKSRSNAAEQHREASVALSREPMRRRFQAGFKRLRRKPDSRRRFNPALRNHALARYSQDDLRLFQPVPMSDQSGTGVLAITPLG